MRYMQQQMVYMQQRLVHMQLHGQPSLHSSRPDPHILPQLNPPATAKPTPHTAQPTPPALQQHIQKEHTQHTANHIDLDRRAADLFAAIEAGQQSLMMINSPPPPPVEPPTERTPSCNGMPTGTLPPTGSTPTGSTPEGLRF
eukprot:CAMPEP_0119304264 /NCGR_PEP_ID=MMETSP1333-20130426/5532_1 /TAXON_ID=418940 /ORGANISM="Scyphosphaera apsteinii, Strain RCC1455" /LENGTH=141 /DNA_ID=CAMNT_0007307115 /DNA_START=231 /DNA_END=656 /DNA_ORIENTATION=-